MRRDTTANWAGSSVPLLAGEPGFDTDQNILKIGPTGGALWTAIGPADTFYPGTAGSNSIAIGSDAGIGQADGAIAIGPGAGNSGQLDSAVAIGNSSGAIDQHANAIAIGNGAGNDTQHDYAVAIGYAAGEHDQGTCGVAIGLNAGNTSQGKYAIAIGTNAGDTGQHDNTIIINATGDSLITSYTDRCYIAPIRQVSGGPPSGFLPLYWDASTGEIVQVAP